MPAHMRGDAPSPIMPVLLLGIVAVMLMGTSYSRWATYGYQSSMRPGMVTPVQKTPSLNIVLIPLVVLVIAVQAFAIYEERHPYTIRHVMRHAGSVFENMSFPVFIVLILMILLLWFNLSLQRPMKQRAYSYPRYQYFPW